MADFLTEKKREITTRLQELRPLVDEYTRLEAAEKALMGVDATTTGRGATGRGRRGGSRGGARRGRPQGSGQRSQQALALVKERPGITIPELAEGMGIKQNYLYRVMPKLQEDGQVRKQGRGWHPVEGAA